MKGQIIDEDYSGYHDIDDEYVSWAYIEKATKYGTFSGMTFCHKDDEDVESPWCGKYLAEYKCDIQAYAAKAKELKARARGAVIVYNNLLQSVPADNEVMQKLLRQVKYLSREAKQLDEKVKYAQADYENFAERELEARRGFRKPFVETEI